MLCLFAQRSAVLVIVLGKEVTVVANVGVVGSQSLQVLAQLPINISQRLTANKSWHFLKGSLFFLLSQRCVVVAVVLDGFTTAAEPLVLANVRTVVVVVVFGVSLAVDVLKVVVVVVSH